jgi:hypothetical protein
VSPKAELRSRVALSDFIERVSARYGSRPPMIFQIARCRKSEKLLGNSPMSRTEPLRTIKSPVAQLAGKSPVAQLAGKSPVAQLAGKSPVAQLAGEFRGPRNQSVSSLLSGPSREITYRTSPPKAGKSPVFADLGALGRAIRPRGGSDHRNLTGIRAFGACSVNRVGFMAARNR